MWQTIILCIRKAYLKHKLKKEKLKTEKIELASQVDGKDSEKAKKLKRKIFVVNIQLIVAIIIPIISFILAAMLLINTLMFIGNVAGWHILNLKETREEEEEKNKNWVWDIDDPNNPNNDSLLGISGGIYPKDPILKNRALLIKVLTRSAKDVSEVSGNTIYPEYLLGTIIRETGGYKICDLIDLNKDSSWITKLTYSNPVCEKKTCYYNKAGLSHFIGGSVVNGKDTGDPYTMKIDTSKESYNKAKALAQQNGNKGDHALGFVQFEVPYIDARMTRTFPADEEFGLTTSDLSFIRPNFFYIPDQIYAMAFLVGQASYSGNSRNIYNTIVNSQDFKNLNERNQVFILFMLEQSAYGCGHLVDSNITAFNELVAANKSGKIDYFDQMLLPYKDKFYNTSTHRMANFDSAQCKNYIRNTYGVYAEGLNTMSWYGIYSACAGRMAWELMTQEVEAAEKEQITTGQGGGRWIDYIGSGKFQPVAYGKYYSQKVQATIYRQTTKTTQFSEASWGTRQLPSTNSPESTTTMAGAGCGVYSTAFCITNLTGTLVTPNDLIDTGIVKSIALHNNKVIELAKHYGLDAYTMSIASDGEKFGQDVIKELQDGGMIVAVWKGANALYGESPSNFPWYGGNGHFMVIRGYNNTNGKLRVYTSVNGVNMDQETTCNYELDASVVRRYLSKSYASCEVIKLKGGAGSIAQTPGGATGPLVNTFNWNLNNPDGSINSNEIKRLQDEITRELGNPRVGWRLYSAGKFDSAAGGCNKYFKSEIKGGMNNLQTLQCTWYAFGRALEYLNEVEGHNFTRAQLSKYLSGNGGKYYYQNKTNNGFAYGSVPKPNSLVCFKYPNSPVFAGHIAYVEAVDYNKKTYRMSECGSGTGWGGITRERSFSDNYGGEVLQGFIYLNEPIEAAKY